MKLLILDRDGTLNPAGEDFVTSPDEWVAAPGALEALARITHAGWHVVLATNQPGLGRGLMDAQTLNTIHTKLHKQLAALGGRIDAIFFCPHTPDEHCTCRKPLPGLLEQACDRYGIERRAARIVGSCAEHLQAGAALGSQHLHFIPPHLSEASEGAPNNPPNLPEGTRCHASLAALADHLLEEGAAFPPAPTRAASTP